LPTAMQAYEIDQALRQMHRYLRREEAPLDFVHSYSGFRVFSSLSQFWVSGATQSECTRIGLDPERYYGGGRDKEETAFFAPILASLRSARTWGTGALRNTLWLVSLENVRSGIERIQDSKSRAQPSRESNHGTPTSVKTQDDARTVLKIEGLLTSVSLRAAYHRMVKKYHPDNFGEDLEMARLAESKTKQINQAYDLLKAGLES